jgi:hypothetical protein
VAHGFGPLKVFLLGGMGHARGAAPAQLAQMIPSGASLSPV